MRCEQKKSIVNSFITSHFFYCQFVWMFHSRSLKHINKIHERTLRLFLKIIIPLLQSLLEKTAPYQFTKETPKCWLKKGLEQKLDMPFT